MLSHWLNELEAIKAATLILRHHAALFRHNIRRDIYADDADKGLMQEPRRDDFSIAIMRRQLIEGRPAARILASPDGASLA